MDNEKGKAIWDDASTEIFINACIEQIYKKERQGSSFTKMGWKNIVSTFNEKAGKTYNKKQLKNRLDILRKDLRTWDALNRETGVGRDPTTNAVFASNEWWQQKTQEKPSYKKFRHTGLKHEMELKIIFRDVMASGEHSFCPTFTQAQSQDEDQDNVYRPSIDLEEGSGDSEEEHFGSNPAASTGLTDEMASIDVTTRTQPNIPDTSGSHGKRKRGEGMIHQKKQKNPTSQQIADAVSVIASASKDRTVSLNKIAGTSMDEVMATLLSIEEVTSDPVFRNRCFKLMMDKTARDLFRTLKGNQEYLVEWLRFMTS